MKNIFVIVALFATLSCMAQKVPVKVQDAFAKNFPNTTVKKWDKENGNYEANFSSNGNNMSATFNAGGNWMETETDIKVSELPVAVSNYVKTNYKGSVIKEAAVISNTQSKKLYEAEVKGKDLLFDENGKFVKEEQD